MSSVPKPFLYEIGRAWIVFDSQILVKEYEIRMWKKIAVVDSIVFAYFICFMCYHKLQDHQNMRQTLKDFEACTQQTDAKLFYHEVALNLLAQCYEMTGDVPSAFKTLRRSYIVEPSYKFNAALWILGVIVHRQISSSKE